MRVQRQISGRYAQRVHVVCREFTGDLSTMRHDPAYILFDACKCCWHFKLVWELSYAESDQQSLQQYRKEPSTAASRRRGGLQSAALSYLYGLRLIPAVIVLGSWSCLSNIKDETQCALHDGQMMPGADEAYEMALLHALLACCASQQCGSRWVDATQIAKYGSSRAEQMVPYTHSRR